MARIIGNTTTTPMPVADWLQTDERKADYIKNKPDIPVVDDTLSAESTNPVENRAITSAIGVLRDLIGETSVSDQITAALAEIPTTNVVHGSEKTLLSTLIENYILFLYRNLTVYQGDYDGRKQTVF